MTELPSRLLRDERGVTLTEMLVVLVFLGMISAAFSVLFSSTIRHNGEITEQSISQGALRAAVDQITNEVREAYIGDGTSAITASTSSQLTFTAPDKRTPFHLVLVSYRVSGGNLQRAFARSTNTGGPPWTFTTTGTPTNWATLASGVTSATPFTYYTTTGVSTTTPASVNSVRATFTFRSGGRTYPYSTSVSMRKTE